MGIIAAVEHIDTQTDDFSKVLEDTVNRLLQEIKSNNLYGKNLDGSQHVAAMEKLIFNRIGLKVNIYTARYMACILPYYSNRNHIFLSDFWRGEINIVEQSKLLNKQEGQSGSVNLHRAKLSGIFSEYTNPLYMNFGELMRYSNLDAAEITAIMLHEIGHGFNACYYADRTDRVNQVMRSIQQRVTNRQGESDLEYVYKEISKVSPSVKKEEIDKFLNGNRVVAGLVWFKVIIGMVKNQMQNDRYNDTAFEELSDSFAGRFGYARPLATGLDKLSQYSIEKHPSAIKLTYLIEVLKIVIVAAITAATLINPVTFITGATLAVLSLFFTYIEGEDFQDYTYDKLKDRYIRLRRDVIEQLKDRSLKVDQVKEMLESIYTLDDIIKNTGEHRSLLNRFSNLIFSSNREALASIEAQKLLESLASNDLFVASAEIRTMKD